jgi:hypothetical protein
VNKYPIIRIRELQHLPRIRSGIKPELHGSCITLPPDNHTIRDTGQENFYSMPRNVRPVSPGAMQASPVDKKKKRQLTHGTSFSGALLSSQ